MIRVGTESVAVPDVATEVGKTEQDTPEGQPEVTLRLTVPLNPPPAVTVNVLEAVPPAPILCDVGKAVIVKSLGGGPVEYVIRILPVNASEVSVPVGSGNEPYVKDP